MRVFLDVVKPQHAARHRRQFAERALELRRIGEQPRRRSVAGRLVALVELFERRAALAAQAHQRFVDDDLAQPAPERRIAAELSDALDQPQHRVVHDLARVFGVADHAQRERVGRPLERAINLLERARIAAARTRQHELRDFDLKAGCAHWIQEMPAGGIRSQACAHRAGEAGGAPAVLHRSRRSACPGACPAARPDTVRPLRRVKKLLANQYD